MTLGYQRSKFVYLSPEVRVLRDEYLHPLDDANNETVVVHFEIIARFLGRIAPQPSSEGPLNLTPCVIEIQGRNHVDS